MPTGVTTYTDVSQRTTTWAMAEMLNAAETPQILSKLGMQKPMPMNKANTAKFRRPIIFPAATTPLVEGVTPSPRKMLYEDVSVTMAEYGDSVQITDVIEYMAEDPVFRDATERCGKQAGRTIEQIIYGVVKAGTNVYYANGTVRTSVNTALTQTLQRKVTKFLKAQFAQPITKILSPSSKYGTQAVEASYVAVTHTDVEASIRDMAGFVPVSAYGTMEPISPHEIGNVENVRYILSADLASFPDGGGTAGSMTTASGTSADVYPIIYFGEEAFGLVPLKGMGAITPMIVPMKPSAADPLAQRGYVSWKTFFAACRLNEAWMVRAEVAVPL